MFQRLTALEERRKPYFVEFDGNVSRDEKGNFIRTRSIFKDIAERKKKREERLEVKEEPQVRVDESKKLNSLFAGREMRILYLKEEADKVTTRLKDDAGL